MLVLCISWFHHSHTGWPLWLKRTPRRCGTLVTCLRSERSHGDLCRPARLICLFERLCWIAVSAELLSVGSAAARSSGNRQLESFIMRPETGPAWFMTALSQRASLEAESQNGLTCSSHEGYPTHFIQPLSHTGVLHEDPVFAAWRDFFPSDKTIQNVYCCR